MVHWVKAVQRVGIYNLPPPAKHARTHARTHTNARAHTHTLTSHRHIRPGFTLISTSDTHTIAAMSHDTLVLVTTNHGNGKWVTYDLTAFKHGGGEVRAWRTAFEGDEDKHALLKGGWQWGGGHDTLTVLLKAGSVTTFEIERTLN